LQYRDEKLSSPVEYGLYVSTEYKPMLGIEDLLAILHYHWCLDTASVSARTVHFSVVTFDFDDSFHGFPTWSTYRGRLPKDIVLQVLPNPSEP
jgi:hypothetical protein